MPKTKFQKYCEKALPRCEATIGMKIKYRNDGTDNNFHEVKRITVDKELEAIVFWVIIPGKIFNRKVF